MVCRTSQIHRRCIRFKWYISKSSEQLFWLYLEYMFSSNLKGHGARVCRKSQIHRRCIRLNETFQNLLSNCFDFTLNIFLLYLKYMFSSDLKGHGARVCRKSQIHRRCIRFKWIISKSSEQYFWLYLGYIFSSDLRGRGARVGRIFVL